MAVTDSPNVTERWQVGSENFTPETYISPDSDLWRIAGENRIYLMVSTAALLQAMVPGIGAGIKQHSNVFADVWDRIGRSGTPIARTIYGPNAMDTAREIYGYHKYVRGVDEKGRYYHAQTPRTFWQAHAAFHYMYENAIDRYTNWHSIGRFAGGRQEVDWKEQLYSETSALFRRYPISDRHLNDVMPSNYSSFQDEWQDLCVEELEMTPAAEWGVELAINEKIDRLPFVRPELWKIGGSIALPRLIHLTAIGGLPETVRQRFGIPWGTREKLELTAVQALAATAGDLAPAENRYIPIARKAFKLAEIKPPSGLGIRY
jgi:uncharacterized protein (DUF2236 family)